MGAGPLAELAALGSPKWSLRWSGNLGKGPQEYQGAETNAKGDRLGTQPSCMLAEIRDQGFRDHRCGTGCRNKEMVDKGLWTKG